MTRACVWIVGPFSRLLLRVVKFAFSKSAKNLLIIRINEVGETRTAKAAITGPALLGPLPQTTPHPALLAPPSGVLIARIKFEIPNLPLTFYFFQRRGPGSQGRNDWGGKTATRSHVHPLSGDAEEPSLAASGADVRMAVYVILGIVSNYVMILNRYSRKLSGIKENLQSCIKRVPFNIF